MTYDRQIPLYKCVNEECGAIHTYDQLLKDEYDEGYECPTCKKAECEYSHSRRAEWVSVAVYSCDRSYGGPEEGGWWYDTGDREDMTIRCFEAGDFPQVNDYIETMELRWNDRQFRVYTYAEKLPPAHFPATRPFYH